ncbi:hypothetical protein [Paludifilum halophilum]|uniref:Bacterial spore germination immunoglobulin-like domain-containing protein n=1 Tax=Paludifilum halophilum TaxID=1642702 RepID=A0A235BAI3_9BACL|nr:hypothetical protein [Paludifilum halophilum]OYD08999.1 hypothetical protein CHM34_04285 [Paludifilum halophilum]
MNMYRTLMISCLFFLVAPSSAVSSPASVGPGLFRIESEHSFKVDGESGQITKVAVQSRMQPEGKAEGTWTFELFFEQGENPNTVRSDDGSAVIPMESPQKTPVDQPESQYYVNVRFEGRVDGQPIELEETYPFSIPGNAH